MLLPTRYFAIPSASSRLAALKPKYLTIIAIVLFFLITGSFIHIQNPDRIHSALQRLPGTDAYAKFATPAKLARNQTLGFQEIFYISLPFRTDRQDAISLLSSFTGIKSTMIEGVDGGSVHPKGKTIASNLNPGAFGCWRSHANIWRKVMDEDIETALIVEDDADWDVNIKDQLFRISQGVLSHTSLLDNQTAYTRKDAPYGTDWDLFFIGQCKSTPPKEKSKIGPVIAVEDPSILPLKKLESKHVSELKAYNITTSSTRAIARVHDTICTTAYAVSRRGAERLLYNWGYKDFGLGIDNEFSFGMNDGKIKGVVVAPPLIEQWKTGTGADSDIDAVAGAASGERLGSEGGSTRNIKNSARKAMKEWVKWQKKR
ncbi:hypothetical protein NA57DRAFT_56498 [Rhizodiscina lignyota]|uniref:Glycosyl transferase family 25 domain-containing protein n=1 Tax=Rhizodiscina lignyota TaxID=1504668 RepID=A0A9P4M6G6_9PEZI|nr:hypothetical protein NA57DRAFT_56498 [Rhizodiscina lignyota]